MLYPSNSFFIFSLFLFIFLVVGFNATVSGRCCIRVSSDKLNPLDNLYQVRCCHCRLTAEIVELNLTYWQRACRVTDFKKPFSTFKFLMLMQHLADTAAMKPTTRKMNREALYSAKPSAGVHAHHMALRHVHSICKADEDQAV